jgi:hypothetical protein
MESVPKFVNKQEGAKCSEWFKNIRHLDQTLYLIQPKERLGSINVVISLATNTPDEAEE